MLLKSSAVLLVLPALVGTALGEADSIIEIYLEVVGLSFTGFFLKVHGEKGTTGMITGITSLQLDSFSKLMLTANMLLGRFDIIAILYIFFSSLRKQ